MTDIFNLVMLVCASIAAMAFGVWTAYGIFRIAFALMHPRRQPVAVKVQPEEATAL
jgi:hypothetical protein